MTSEDRKQLAREIVEAHVPPAMAGVVLAELDAATCAPSVASADDDVFLTVHEVAQMLSSPTRRVHTSTVYRMLDRGELPEQRGVGRGRRVRRSDLLRYLDEHHVQASPRAASVRVIRRSEDEERVLSEHDWLKAI